MSCCLANKVEIIKPHRMHDNDSGSSFVQVALLTARIEKLSNHMIQHAHDFDCRRSLLCLVARRSRFLRYIKSNFPQQYELLTAKLGIRIKKAPEKYRSFRLNVKGRK